MVHASSEQLERRYQRRLTQARRLQIPSWWRIHAPGRGPRFWRHVEALRKDAGVQKWDTSGMTHIITNLHRSLK